MPSYRQKQPPWGFECSYKHCCPHLEGLSAEWVWEEYQHSHGEHLDHWKVRDIQQEQLEKALDYIVELEKQNEELKAKLKALHKRQFKSNKNDCRKINENTLDDKSHPEKKKKRGAPKGHPGWFRRKPDHIDKIVIVPAPDVCPHCTCDALSPMEEIKDHLQEDIVLQPRTHVTNFRHHQAFCSKCNRAVIQAAQGELLNCKIGPTTKAVAVFLRYGLRIPYRKVQELFDVFFNMPFVPASAMAFDRTATCKGEPLYEDLKEKLRHTAAANADETYWREDGIGHYVWYAGNDDLALFHIDRHRSSKVAQMILGNNYNGVLTSDGYAAYNAVNAKDRQSCLAHLIRKSKEIKQEILLRKPQFQDKQSIQFCSYVSALFKKTCEIGQKLTSGDIKQNRASAFETRMYSALNSICSTKLADKKSRNVKTKTARPQKGIQPPIYFPKIS